MWLSESGGQRCFDSNALTLLALALVLFRFPAVFIGLSVEYDSFCGKDRHRGAGE